MPTGRREASLPAHTTDMDASIKLELSVVRATPELLTFRYRAHNLWTRELYLFNRLFVEEPSGERRVDPSKVYVLSEGGVLRVSKQLFPVPDGLAVEWPEVPYLTRLAAGASFEEEIDLKLPAREAYPYMDPEVAASAGERKGCEQLVFTLGYFQAKEPRWVRSISVGAEATLATDYGFAIQGNQSVSSASQRVRTECVVLADPRRRPRS